VKQQFLAGVFNVLIGLRSSGWSISRGMACSDRRGPQGGGQPSEGRAGGVVGLVLSRCPEASLHPACHVPLLGVDCGWQPAFSSRFLWLSQHSDLGGERKRKRAAMGPGHPYALQGGMRQHSPLLLNISRDLPVLVWEAARKQIPSQPQQPPPQNYVAPPKKICPLLREGWLEAARVANPLVPLQPLG